MTIWKRAKISLISCKFSVISVEIEAGSVTDKTEIEGHKIKIESWLLTFNLDWVKSNAKYLRLCQSVSD